MQMYRKFSSMVKEHTDKKKFEVDRDERAERHHVNEGPKPPASTYRWVPCCCHLLLNLVWCFALKQSATIISRYLTSTSTYCFVHLRILIESMLFPAIMHTAGASCFAGSEVVIRDKWEITLLKLHIVSSPQSISLKAGAELPYHTNSYPILKGPWIAYEFIICSNSTCRSYNMVVVYAVFKKRDHAVWSASTFAGVLHHAPPKCCTNMQIKHLKIPRLHCQELANCKKAQQLSSLPPISET